ncbi:MAG TPA: hypothetical protein VFQ46_08825 [Candidatus Limnocylindria bacterium]|nr:hypothetical protein [Candidatus Limnocylindria bacterium]
MSMNLSATGGKLGSSPQMQASGYQAGACNIGPAEIARRRRTGHIGLAITVLLLGVLLALDAPGWLRLIVFLPAAVGAAGYLQAHFRFCADYGWRGVFNVGDQAGHDRTTDVVDTAARRADRRRAMLISAGSGVIGLAVTLLALVL